MTGIASIALVGRISQRKRWGVGRMPQAVAAVVLTTAVVVFTLTYAEPGQRGAAAVLSGLLVAVPMGVALLALRVEAEDRFSRLLFAAGVLFSVTALAQSPDPVLYSLGRISVWLAVPLGLYLMLSFPVGRLVHAHDRRLTSVLLALAAVLYLPTALIVDRFPAPTPWTTCDHCPANAFALANLDGVIAVVRPVREVILVLVMLGVAASLVWRIRRAGPLLRRALEPVLVIAVVQVAAYVVYQAARAGGSVSPGIEVIGWLTVLCLPGVAIAFAIGLLRRRLRVAAVLQRLTFSLRAPATAAALRLGLAEALEDPSLRIVYWLPGSPGRWVDEAGWPTDIEHEPPSRRITEVAEEGRLVAAVVHDASLAPEPSLVRAAAAYGMVVLENTQLIAHLRASLRELDEAEERTAVVAADERRRIERDLHDGAQQQLLALRINLSLLAERLGQQTPEAEPEFAVLGGQIEHTIEELRRLARGSYPAVLTEHGLAHALRVAALESPLPAVVHARTLGRYPAPVEAAVYFSCVEALQNAVKHAHGATGVSIALSEDGDLRFEVSDDGVGFSAGNGHDGLGLRNMSARLVSVGGRLEVSSIPGRGTHVIGTIPRG
jgi:signal transduction histidine kinase